MDDRKEKNEWTTGKKKLNGRQERKKLNGRQKRKNELTTEKKTE